MLCSLYWWTQSNDLLFQHYKARNSSISTSETGGSRIMGKCEYMASGLVKLNLIVWYDYFSTEISSKQKRKSVTRNLDKTMIRLSFVDRFLHAGHISNGSSQSLCTRYQRCANIFLQSRRQWKSLPLNIEILSVIHRPVFRTIDM